MKKPPGVNRGVTRNKENQRASQPLARFILSQYAPKANPPPATFNPYAGIPHPIVRLRYLVELPNALQRIDAWYEH